MTEVRYEQKLDEPQGYVADAVFQDTVFEIRRGARELRRLQGSLFGLAQAVAAVPGRRAVLILVDPGLSRERLEAAWKSLSSIVRGGIIERMAIWTVNDGQNGVRYDGFPEPPTEGERDLLVTILAGEKTSGRPRGSGTGGSFSEILKVLLHQWLLGRGPMTSSWLGSATGYSYPTVAKALRRLDGFVLRSSDQRVELACFPKDEWARMVLDSDRVRGTVRFTDRAGGGRSPESLLRRFRNLDLPSVAIGGVEGARHYCPDLDLIGLPRIDLCVHGPKSGGTLDFVHSIDPGLEQTKERDPACPLVIHFLNRAKPMFAGRRWADPVECLLDLHEARLEPQALQFLRSFPPAQKENQEKP